MPWQIVCHECGSLVQISTPLYKTATDILMHGPERSVSRYHSHRRSRKGISELCPASGLVVPRANMTKAEQVATTDPRQQREDAPRIDPLLEL